MPKRTKRLSHEEICHIAWQRMRGPFLLPAWATHKHEWEPYDMGVAGCVKCGVQHTCQPFTCSTVQLEDGASVCPITGLCIPCLRTSVSEFSDCIAADPTRAHDAEAQTAAERDESLSALITQTLEELILSPKAEQLLKVERDKLSKRRMITFSKQARQVKVSSNANMIDILAHTIYRTSNYRTPLILPAETRRELCQTCTGNILRVFKLLNLHGEGRGWKRSIHRTRSLIVGLVYMARMGVMWNDTVILPCMPIMRDVLPQEACLSALFGMRPKIITETENFVKMSIRCTAVSEILRFAGDQHTML